MHIVLTKPFLSPVGTAHHMLTAQAEGGGPLTGMGEREGAVDSGPRSTPDSFLRPRAPWVC